MVKWARGDVGEIGPGACEGLGGIAGDGPLRAGEGLGALFAEPIVGEGAVGRGGIHDIIGQPDDAATVVMGVPLGKNFCQKNALRFPPLR